MSIDFTIPQSTFELVENDKTWQSRGSELLFQPGIENRTVDRMVQTAPKIEFLNLSQSSIPDLRCSTCNRRKDSFSARFSACTANRGIRETGGSFSTTIQTTKSSRRRFCSTVPCPLSCHDCSKNPVKIRGILSR